MSAAPAAGTPDAPRADTPAAGRADARFVRVRETMLHVRSSGPEHAPSGDAPTLVYLHSLGTDMRIWDPVVARLPGLTSVRIDLRGHGLSDVPPGEYTIGAMSDDVLSVLAHSGIERAVLVGVSIGGQVALRAALARPELVRGVVALDTAARIADAERWEERMAAVRDGGLVAIADEVVGRWFSPSIQDRATLAPRGYRNLLLRTPAAGYIAACAALRDEDLSEHLASIARPVLVLCGSEDTATPPALARSLADALPQARYAEIADAGHLPCIDRPEATAQHIGDFVRALQELDRPPA
jgi:3-oxoadipate enol-lactonase